MADSVNVWELIKSELPKFATDMGIPFLGDTGRSSVTESMKPAAQEQINNESLFIAAPQVALAAYAAPSALAALSTFPRATSIAAAVITKDPTTLISNPALSFSASIPESEGAIRPGGRPDLNLTHESSISSLLNVLTGRKVLTHPSIAISSNDAAPFNGHLGADSATLLMNPTSHYFDPATAHANQLINRDSFSTRWRGPLPKEVRLNKLDLNFTEPFAPSADPARALDSSVLHDILYNNAPQQSLSIAGSPKFNSLAQYEDHQYGAKTLSRTDSLSYHGTESAIESVYPGLLSELARAPDAKLAKTFVNLQSKKAAEGDIKAGMFMGAIGSTFSNYAELKGVGNIPVSGKTVSAIMLDPRTDSTLRKSIIKQADSLGIKAGTAEDLAPKELKQTAKDHAIDLHDVLTGVKKPYPNMLGFVDNINIWHDINMAHESGQLSKGQARKAIYEEVVKSNKFAGLVASSLTTADANAAKQITSQVKGKP